MLPTASSLVYFAAPLLLSLAADALPHDDHGSMEMDMGMDGGTRSGHMGPAASTHAIYVDDQDYLMSYFSYQKHSGTIIAHIALMILAWFFILPIGTISQVSER